MKFADYPKNFWIICFGLLFFIMSFNTIIPELNEFLKTMHPEGKNYIGLIILLFSVSAGLARPYSGKLSDHIGRKKVMYIGAIVGFLTVITYPFVGLLSPIGAILFFFTLRFIHGFSAGFLPTGATALVTDVLTPAQRGIGMGIWGTFISVGFGSGQILSSWITDTWNINVLFYVSGGFALIALIIVSQLKETLPAPQKFKRSHLKLNFQDVFEPTVLPAATVMLLSTISTGIVFVMSSEISKMLGVNKGWFFGFYVISTIVVRLFASSVSDKIGRRKSLVIGQSFMFLSMFTVAFSQDLETVDSRLFVYSLGAIIFGISTGISSPTVFAWTADLSPEKRRGVGAGTLFIALEIGIGIGSGLTMISYNDNPETVFRTFMIGAATALTAVCFLIWHIRNRDSKT